MKKISLTDLEILHLREFYKSELEAAKKRIATLTSVLSKLGEVTDADEKEVNKLLESDVVVNKKSEKKVVQKTEKKRGRPPKAKTAATPVESEVKPVTKVSNTKTPRVKVSKPKVSVAKAKDVAKPKAKRGRKPKNQQSLKVVESPKTLAEKKTKKRKVNTVRKPIKVGKGTDKVKWNEFVINAITSSNKLLHSGEITMLAMEKFGTKKEDMDRVRLVVAGALTKLLKANKLIVHKKAKVRGGLYGLPEWRNESGELLKEISDKL